MGGRTRKIVVKRKGKERERAGRGKHRIEKEGKGARQVLRDRKSNKDIDFSFFMGVNAKFLGWPRP